MNSRQRVRQVLDHRIPDRIPNALGGCETAGMHVLAYDSLKKVLGVQDPVTRMDTFMTNAVFEPTVMEAMEADVMLVSSPMMCKARFRGPENMDLWKKIRLWGQEITVPKADSFVTRPDGSVCWESGGGRICPPEGQFFDFAVKSDLFAEIDVPDPKDYREYPDFTDEVLREMEDTCKFLYETTDYSLCMGETITDLQAEPCGMLGTMVLLMEEPEVMQEILGYRLEAGLRQLRQLHQAIGSYVDVLSIAHDFGDNRGVLVGADTWRTIYKPFYRELFGQWKKITGMKINLHSCGSIIDILDDLVECGVDILNPVQISARGMDPAALKEKYADRLVFLGGAYDSQLFARTDSYEAVYEKVCRTIRTLSAGGGYLFAGVHNLPGDMPPEHIRAMMDAWKECRDYF